MKMSDDEIVKAYKDYPMNSTIDSLASKNNCSYDDIIEILNINNIEIIEDEYEDKSKTSWFSTKKKNPNNTKPSAVIKDKFKPIDKSEKLDNSKKGIEAVVDEIINENSKEVNHSDNMATEINTEVKEEPKRKPGRKPGRKSSPRNDKSPEEILRDSDLAIEEAIKILDAKIARLVKKRDLLKEAIKIDEL